MNHDLGPQRPEEPREAGLTDRSERPTTHALFAPTEKRKQREEDRLKAGRRAKRRRAGG
jgi:hypothetical protein